MMSRITNNPVVFIYFFEKKTIIIILNTLSYYCPRNSRRVNKILVYDSISIKSLNSSIKGRVDNWIVISLSIKTVGLLIDILH